MKTLAEWLEGIRAAIPSVESGQLDRFIEDVTTALLAMDPEDLKGQGLDGPRRSGFYRDAVLTLVYPRAAYRAA